MDVVATVTADLFVNCQFSCQCGHRSANEARVMSERASARDIVANPRHPRYSDAFVSQTNKAWALACFFRKVSEIPGSNMPNIKEFSTERQLVKRRIQQLRELYPEADDEHNLYAAEGDLFELPVDVVVCIPIGPNNFTGFPRNNLDYGEISKHTVGKKLFVECCCLPALVEGEYMQITLETRIYWLLSCLDSVLEQCQLSAEMRLALPFRFNSVISFDSSNWVHYVSALEDWSQRHRDRCQLIIVLENLNDIAC